MSNPDERPRSLMKTHPLRVDIVLLGAASLALLSAGLSMPVITLKKVYFWSDTYSILSGIRLLWQESDRFLAGILFFFSIVFPFTKLIGLLVIWTVPLTRQTRGMALDWLGVLGKWSMLDVFVAAVTIVVVRFGKVTEAHPRPGLYYFTAAIMLSMVLTVLIERVAKRSHFAGPSKYSM